jgi:hypothetical protein
MSQLSLCGVLVQVSAANNGHGDAVWRPAWPSAIPNSRSLVCAGQKACLVRVGCAGAAGRLPLRRGTVLIGCWVSPLWLLVPAPPVVGFTAASATVAAVECCWTFTSLAGALESPGPDRRRIPYALLNLQEPAQRLQISALASLRTQYGDARVRFDRFDVAYAVWWQRLNPHVALTVERLPFAHTSEVVATVLGEVSELPVFGSAVRVMEILARRYKRSRTLCHEPTLRELDELPHDQLGDAVTYLFARDLNAHGDYVLGVDAYEALVGGVSRVGGASFADAWLRDLVLQLDRGLVAVASRESLGWEQHDSQWGSADGGTQRRWASIRVPPGAASWARRVGRRGGAQHRPGVWRGALLPAPRS